MRARGIREVLHFTTNKGLLGIIATGQLKARSLLERDEYLEFIFSPNARIRKDPAWVDHVSLSVSRVNASFFGISRIWHATEDIWWCILSIDPVVLIHPGVTFVTTNNIWSGALRGPGMAGFTALFAPQVHQYLNLYAERQPGMPESWTTCPQAEVLYPRYVPSELLKRVYVSSASHLHIARAQMATLNHPEVELVIAPQVFRQAQA